MSHPLEGVRAKVGRAREHFHTIERELHSFMQGDPDTTYGFVIEIDHDRGECFVRWGEHTAAPIRWSLILGEFFYDLRSALDHLARQLVVANKVTPGKTEFPVFWDESEFDRRPARYTKGMTTEQIAVTKSLQPFSEWPEHPEQTTLWRIHDLCNIDKHRLLHLTDLWLYRASVRFVLPVAPEHAPPIQKHFLASSQRLKPHAELAHFTWDPAKMKGLGEGQVQMNVDLALDVALTEGEWLRSNGQPAEGMPVRRVMGITLDYMETTLLPAFAPFFPTD